MLLSLTKSYINYQLQKHHITKKHHHKNIILDDLPIEILYIILLHIPREYDSHLQQVSKKWYKIIKKIRIANNCANSTQIFIKYPLPVGKDICCIDKFDNNLKKNYNIFNFPNGNFNCLCDFMIKIIDTNLIKLNYNYINDIINWYLSNGAQFTNDNINDFHIAYNYIKQLKKTHKDICFRCCYQNEYLFRTHIPTIINNSLSFFGIHCIIYINYLNIIDENLPKFYINIMLITQI